LWSALVLAFVLASAEGLARLAGPWLLPPTERVMPVAAPGWTQDFQNQALADRERLGAHPPIPLAEDADRGWILPRSVQLDLGGISYRTNELGLRGPPVRPRPAGTERLLTLGDSSIFGDEVAEAAVFGNVAATRLAATWGRPVEAVNGGVPGHTSTQSLRNLEELGSKIQPTWVVIGNLWSDVYRNDRGGPGSQPAVVRDTRGGLQHLAAYQLLRYALSPWLRSAKVRFIARRGDVAADASQARVPLHDYIANLEAMATRSDALGARPVFLVLAAPMDLDRVPPPELVEEYREGMRQVADRHDAPLLDGPALFREHGATAGYFVDQVHPSDYGHALLGNGLADLLGPLGPVDAGPPAAR